MLGLACIVACAPATRDDAPADGSRASATFAVDETFWSEWGDGRAELAGYDLSYVRYGEPRRGTAVAILVTETFAADARVKHEDSRRPAERIFPVLKLNLVQDFPTGIYDYNLMTTVFVGLGGPSGPPPGYPAKVAFSAQEWCGQAYAQAVFDRDSVELDSHSYFDGEGDEARRLPAPAGGLAEDALWLWARGLAAPRLGPGEVRRVPLLRSLERVRLGHVVAAWDEATLSRGAEARETRVPAGRFEVERYEAVIAAPSGRRTYPPGGAATSATARRWTFDVERSSPHRIVRWERDDGSYGELLASERVPYWEMNGPGLEAALERLGLQPRPPRTP